MQCQQVHLLHLPDELLMIIFKKLEKYEVLYSLMHINMRLDQNVSEPIFTREITLMIQNASTNLISPLPGKVLDRFCSLILPAIHDKIEWLNLETLSMERVLTASNYTNLRQLDIFITNQEIDMHLFTKESPAVNIFQNQIVTLCVNGYGSNQCHSKMNPLASIFLNILLLFTNLCHLKFYPLATTGTGYVSFANQCPTFSSTLRELHINVYRFDDCLFLLDGRLDQLRILFVRTFHVLPLQRAIIAKDKLPNLKQLSLECISDMCVYDEVIVPHLQRMSHLTNLALYFVTSNHGAFIDGCNLKKNITSHMPRLSQFLFNIRSTSHLSHLTYYPSREDIHRTFTSFEGCQVVCNVDYFSKEGYGQCHVYSYPYTLTHYDDLTNTVPDGLFNNVRTITLFDERPFEHEFFMKISQAFPFLQDLTITNSEPQKSDDSNRKPSIVGFSHLTRLHLLHVHDDYVEQFLLDTKTCLSHDIRLTMDYDQLQCITDHFSREATRNNCSKIKTLSFHDFVQLPKCYNTYFPHLE